MTKQAMLIAAFVLAIPLAAHADTPHGYGNLHLTIGQFDKGLGEGTADELALRSHTSSIGVRGETGLDYGLAVIYQIEVQDPTNEDGVISIDRDQWIGLVSKPFGTVRLGKISHNYKSTGELIDPLYRTPFEARGFINAQSALHRGIGPLGGRSTNTIRYDSISIDGVTLVANYALNPDRRNVFGYGMRYEIDKIKVYADGLYDNQNNGQAVKAGGVYRNGPVMIGGQLEVLNAAMVKAKNTAGEALAVSVAYTLERTTVAYNYGKRNDRHTGRLGSTGWAVAFIQQLNTSASVYFGFADYNAEDDNLDNAGFAVGLRQYF